ncbi:MAG: hypothetical protein N2323_00005 [candidate division WOR-3 bacterium]|nr:hypothetical protein [candidate division WOR-3 bacterium]MCX7836332.1 hypothetical protein [candidate division WOR-3 bacterium]MDW8113563.1 hypothetical protein [candidate division WOR-3 bacterium]
MKRYLILFIFFFLFSQEYVGEFEELGTSALGVGLGQAMVALKKDGSSFYYNPSLTCLHKKREFYFYHSENYGGQFRNEYFSLILPKEKYAFGFSLYINLIPNVPYCSLPNPNLPPNEETNKPIFVKNVFAYDLIFYSNFATFLKDFLLFGLNIKLIYRNIYLHYGFGCGADIGFSLIPTQNLLLGLRIRNFTTSPILWSDKKVERIKPNLAVGISKNFGSLTIAYENEPSLNKLPDNNNFGLEYKIKDLVSFRMGFYHRCFSFGFGITYRSIYLDYGYETKKYLDSDLPSSILKISGGVKF